MQRFIAFLRAINVGGHTVKMDALRALFEGLGFGSVETFIASGNVIFESQSESERMLEQQIERHLQQALGYEVATFIRSSSELAALANYQPFSTDDLDAEGASLYITFLHALPTAEAQQKLLALRTADDDFHFHRREIYWLRRKKISESKLFSGALFERLIGTLTTMRNVTTVKKLASKYASPQ